MNAPLSSPSISKLGLLFIFLAAALPLPQALGTDELGFPELPKRLSMAIPLDGLDAEPVMAAPSGGSSSEAAPGSAPRAGRTALRTGLGFTLSPTDLLLSLELDHFFTKNFALGPLFQFGVSDDPFIFAPTLNLQGMFDIPGVDVVKPFVQGGLGIAYIGEDHQDHWRDDVGFLINFGCGLEFFLSDRISLGTNILFNFLPVDTLGENYFFSWQFVTFRFQF